MKRTVLTALVAAALAAAGCGTMTQADCQIQSSANGPYLVKLSQAGAISGAGCTTTETPDTFADLWLFDPYDNGLIVAYPTSGPLPDPPNANDAVYGKGKFTDGFPDANQECKVASLTTMTIAPGVTYATTNMVWLSTALYLGTEFKADVTYTTGACSRPYTAQAINPAVQCGTKEDCDPFAQPFASGINSAYDTDCNLESWATTLSGDPATGFCFFIGPYPSTGGWKPVTTP
jgi:hypothetical protein